MTRQEAKAKGVSSLTKRKLPRAVLILVTAFLVLVLLAVTDYLYGQLRHGQFGLIDDHEILAYFGTKSTVRLSDIPRILATQTEVGDWGHTLRFRPVYYFFRVLETIWHGRNAGAWYLTRMALAAATAAGFGFMTFRVLAIRAQTPVRQLVALVAAATASLIILTLPAWTDIVMRLGPSEIYVAFGIMLVVVGGREVWVRQQGYVGWLLAFIGFIIVVGSKEDGLILLPLMGTLFIFRFPHARVRIVVIALGALAAMFSVYVALGFLPAVISSNSDVYGNGHTLAGFIGGLPDNVYVVAAVLFLILAVLCEVALAARPHLRPTSTWSRIKSFTAARPRSLAAAACLYIVLGELYFYQDYVHGGTFEFGRYGLLTQMAVATSFIVIATGVAELALQRRVSGLALTGVILALAVLPPTVQQVAAASAYRAMSGAITTQLTTQYAQITAGVHEVKSHPRNQIVILLEQPNDYERIVGLATFLRIDDHIHSLFIRTDIPNQARAVQPALSKQLDAISADGGLKQNGWQVTPINRYDPSEATTCFYFGPKPEDTTSCSALFQIQ